MSLRNNFPSENEESLKRKGLGISRHLKSISLSFVEQQACLSTGVEKMSY